MNDNESEVKALPTTWVWRKRGSNSPESLCRFSSYTPVRAAVEAPPAPSPCSLNATPWRHNDSVIL